MVALEKLNEGIESYPSISILPNDLHCLLTVEPKPLANTGKVFPGGGGGGEGGEGGEGGRGEGGGEGRGEEGGGKGERGEGRGIKERFVQCVLLYSRQHMMES